MRHISTDIYACTQRKCFKNIFELRDQKVTSAT